MARVRRRGHTVNHLIGPKPLPGFDRSARLLGAYSGRHADRLESSGLPMRFHALTGSPLLLSTLPLAAAAPVTGNVVWKADFETGDISQFDGSVNATRADRKNIEIV